MLRPFTTARSFHFKRLFAAKQCFVMINDKGKRRIHCLASFKSQYLSSMASPETNRDLLKLTG